MNRIALLAVAWAVGCGDSSPSAPEQEDGSTSSAGEAESTGGEQAPASSSGGDVEGDSTGSWWATSSGATFTASGVDGDAGEEGEEEGEDEGEFETFAEWFGEGTIEPGVSYDGIVEAIVVDQGVEQCIVFGVASNVTWLDTCSECQFAFSFTVSEVEAEVTEGCAAAGIDVDSLDGMTQTVGVGEKELYREMGGRWVAGGEAFYDAGKSRLEYLAPI